MKKILIITTAILSVITLCVVIRYISNDSKEKSQNIKVSALNAEKQDIKENENIIEESEDMIEEHEEAIKEENTNANIKTDTVNGKYYIKVNYLANCVTIYSLDSNGKYTVPIKAMVCSTGTATPRSGVYQTSDKYEWGWLVGGVYGCYSTRIVGDILFHSIPYTRYKDPGSLEYWEFDKLGTTASAGCVRLAVGDAKWIYDNCPKGTQVEFYADSNPGPLGKPEAMKISNADEKLRVWDPTDPNENNPWKTYKKEIANTENSLEVVVDNKNILTDKKDDNNIEDNKKETNQITNSNVVSNVVNTNIINNVVNKL